MGRGARSALYSGFPLRRTAARVRVGPTRPTLVYRGKTQALCAKLSERHGGFQPRGVVPRPRALSQPRFPQVGFTSSIFMRLLIDRARLGALALTAAASTGPLFGNSILLHDSFADGSRTNANLPASARWTYNAASLSNERVNLLRYSSGDELLFVRGSPSQSAAVIGYFAPQGSPVQLADGDTLYLTFSLRLGVAVNRDDIFRFGVFNSLGATRPTADMNLSHGNLSDSRMQTAQGYSAFINPGATASAPFNLYRRTSAVAAHPLLPTQSIAGSPVVTNERMGAGNSDILEFPLNQRTAMAMTVRRTGNNLVVEASVNGRTVSRTDTTTATNFAFDMIAFYCDANLVTAGQPNAFFDDFKVVYLPSGAGDGGRVTVFEDTFDDGERITQNLPNSAQWFYKGSVTAPQTTATQLRIPDPGFSTANSNLDLIVRGLPGNNRITLTAPFTAALSPQSLNVGDSLTARFSVLPLVLRNIPFGLRLGLFDSQGARPAADFAGSNSNPAGVYTNYRGISVGVNPSPSSPADIGFFERQGTATELFDDTANVALGSAPTTTRGFIPNQFTRGSLKLTRIDASTLRVETSFNGILRSSDLPATQFTFDTVAIHLAEGMLLEGESVRVDDVTLFYTPAASSTVSSPSTVISENFDGNAWPALNASASGATASAVRGPVGVVEGIMSITPTQGVRLDTDSSGAAGGWSATLRSGLLPVSNTQGNLAFLTLAFDLSASAARPVLVGLESYDASGTKTGRLERLIYPAAPQAWQRFAFELDGMSVAEPGFDATAPQLQLTFSLSGGDAFTGWPSGTHRLSVDNLHFARPAFYVRPDGNNNADGRTPETAFATPARVMTAVSAGDIVLFMSDPNRPDVDYLVANESQLNNQGVVLSQTGRAAGWITFKNYPGHKPRFQSYGWRVFGIGAGAAPYSPPVAYVEFRGLSLRGVQYLPVSQNNAGLVIGVANTTAIDFDSRPTINTAHHFRLADCHLFDCAGLGMAFLHSDYIQVENNLVHDNGRWTRYGPSGMTILGGNPVDGLYDNYRVFFLNNYVFNNESLTPWAQINAISDGNGIIVDSNLNTGFVTVGPYPGRTLIQNNVTYDNGGSGIHVFRSIKVDTINNTAFGNNRVMNYGEITYQDANNGIAQNNILVATDNRAVTYRVAGTLPGTSLSPFINNVYVRSPAGPEPVTWTVDRGNLLVPDARFAAPGRDIDADFRLRGDSPALGFGASSPIVPSIDFAGLPRALGAGIDAGAYSRQPLILRSPASLTVNAGATATLTVSALGDGLAYQWLKDEIEIGGETGPSLTLTGVTSASAGSYRVRVSNGYDSRLSAAATVRVLSLLDQWRLATFGTADNTGTAADTADMDLDGLPNLLEYALGTNPTVNDGAGTISQNIVAIAGERFLSIRFNVRLAARGVTLKVQSSGNLSTWSDIALPSTNVVSETTNGALKTYEVRDSVALPATGEIRRYLRLAVTPDAGL